MHTITATDEELIALRQLLHRAVLHSGMDVADAATYWNRKIIEAMGNPPPKPNGKPQEAAKDA